MPLLCCPCLPETGAQSSAGTQGHDDQVVVIEPEPVDEEVDFRQAVLGDPIVGTAVIVSDSRGQGAVSPRTLPSPKEPTPAARERHNLTHQPPEFGCPFCLSGRRCNDQHRKVKDDQTRTIPLLVGDYAHVRNQHGEDLASRAALKLYPGGLFFAQVIGQAGLDLRVSRGVAKA